jgi:hypothetical protein
MEHWKPDALPAIMQALVGRFQVQYPDFRS